MSQTVFEERKVPVVISHDSQTVRIPDEFRFSSQEIYIGRDSETGAILLSEKPLARPTPTRSDWQALWDEIDTIGATDFAIERDKSLPRDIEL